MQEAIEHSTLPSQEAARLVAASRRAEAWAREPFLRPDEDPADALAEGRARRHALDDAVAEMEEGRTPPSHDWKVKYALMLGLERVLTDHPPRLASETELRRHQIDALAGMLTELISAREEEATGNGEAGAVASAFGEEDIPDEEVDEEPTDDELLDVDEADLELDDPGAGRRYRFRHPTASGKTIAAAGFVEAARTMGVLILTHRRLLVSQFTRDLTTEGYGERLQPAIVAGKEPLRGNPITIQTYAWFARHVGSLSRQAYQLVICDEAHTALGEKTSAAIRSLPEPIFVGMTATEQLIAKSVSEVFPASVDDLPLTDAARRGLIAPLRSLRVPPAAAISSVPIVGGDYDEGALARVLDHAVINQAAASLYRDRFSNAAGIVYAAGVEHAYNLAREFRAAGLKAEAVSGRTPPLKLAETLAAYERGEINVLINAQLLAEGWNSPRATVCMHLSPTASRRVYQQRIGRIMRMHPRKEAGVVVDFVDPAATHNERTITIHSLLDSDFYRQGARVTPAPRRRVQRRARRKLSPASWLVPVTPDVLRRIRVITREWERVDPGRLAEDEQQLWAGVAGRQMRYDERQQFAEKLARAPRETRDAFLMSCAAENPNRRLRMSALGDRVSIGIDRASFDDLVTMVTLAPTWEKDRIAGVRVLLRAIGDAKVDAPEDILNRWTWRLAKATRKIQDRRASSDLADAKKLLGALTNSRGHRHDENAARLVNVALEQPVHVGVALLVSAEGYTPTSQQLIGRARERLGGLPEIAAALADNLPAPKQPKRRRRRRKKKGQRQGQQTQTQHAGVTAAPGDGAAEPEKQTEPKVETREADQAGGVVSRVALDGDRSGDSTAPVGAASSPDDGSNQRSPKTNGDDSSVSTAASKQ